MVKESNQQRQHSGNGKHFLANVPGMQNKTDHP
jgi:hypothetical protein